MASPSNRRATKRRRSSITELAVHGIHTSRPKRRKVLPMCPVRSVTYVSGRSCPLTPDNLARDRSKEGLQGSPGVIARQAALECSGQKRPGRVAGASKENQSRGGSLDAAC